MTLPGRRSPVHWVIYDDGGVLAVEADHFTFERSHLTLRSWTIVLMRPKERVVRRLPLGGLRPIRGVMTDEPLPAASW